MTEDYNQQEGPTANTPSGYPVDEAIQAIKTDLRAAMNGVAAKSFRQSGTAYRLVYGVELPRLRSIAAEYKADRRLALALWNDNIRETRMLAVMLFPIEEFDADMADLWAEALRRDEAELAGLLVMDLLAAAPYASEKAFRWMADEREVLQLCGFLLMTRLFMQGAELSQTAEAEFLDQATATLPTDYLPLRKAVTNALLRYGLTSPSAQNTTDKILLCT
ncbi:MAG: DNA alkylation repair protein [Bacteroidaceae bacterium]|nr:DNA alkylation repair protein [Bacteroidaceae bacterium]